MSKICTELDAHLGLADKTLAEFIIHLAGEHTDPKVSPVKQTDRERRTEGRTGGIQSVGATCGDKLHACHATNSPPRHYHNHNHPYQINHANTHPQAFRAALDENGAEFPPALCDKLWALIKAMQVGRSACMMSTAGKKEKRVGMRGWDDAHTARRAASTSTGCHTHLSTPYARARALHYTAPLQPSKGRGKGGGKGGKGEEEDEFGDGYPHHVEARPARDDKEAAFPGLRCVRACVRAVGRLVVRTVAPAPRRAGRVTPKVYIP